MKQFLCDCVNPIFGTQKLDEIIDKAKQIQKARFYEACNVDEAIREEMATYPNDYEYFKSEDGEYYFYTWSAIEHIYGD